MNDPFCSRPFKERSRTAPRLATVDTTGVQQSAARMGFPAGGMYACGRAPGRVN